VRRERILLWMAAAVDQDKGHRLAHNAAGGVEVGTASSIPTRSGSPTQA
jgi:hypothetical protein